MSDVSSGSAELRWRFGADRSGWSGSDADLTVLLSIPVLDGPIDEEFAIIPDGEAFSSGAFRGYRNDTQIAAAAVVPLNGDAPEKAARDVYTDLLDLTADLPAYRTWNFVPGINAEIDGLEAYRSFNLGRGSAYEERFGLKGMGVQLPAASALGIEGDALFVAFLGGTERRSYFENPNQVPASQYPADYGPRSPSFARGAVVHDTNDRRVAYLSGTSSILGHETIGIGDLAKQTETTVENVNGMIAHMGFDLHALSELQLRVYVRKPADLQFVRDAVATAFPMATGKTVFVQADICREALMLEVEGIAVA